MGVCYTVILMDEFDWAYVGTSKEQKIEEFKNSWDAKWPPELLGQWYGFMVWDLDKRTPYYEPYLKIINKFSDKAWYIPDNAFYDLKELESSN